MKIKSKHLIYIVFAFVLGLLLYVSSGAYNPASSILAQVEPQKHAISFHKAVRVTDIYVIPGQRVDKGDPLLKVERQDLLLDVEKTTHTLERLISEKEALQIEMQFEKELAQMNLELKTNTINAELKRLELLKSEQAQLSKSLLTLNIWNDTLNTSDQAYISMRIQVLHLEKSSILKQYLLSTQKQSQLNRIKNNNLDNQLVQIRSELDLLRAEKAELLQIAKQDGTVGNLFAEEDELVTPYSTLISIYEHNPSIIRALVNENQRFELQSGQHVLVESTNRKYKVTGTILEIGTRIVEYPSRLKSHPDLMMYGRELFISIPTESDFLHGEKVYVKLK